MTLQLFCALRFKQQIDGIEYLLLTQLLKPKISKNCLSIEQLLMAETGTVEATTLMMHFGKPYAR